ncbi:MAG: shikimate kinase [Dehalococcoidia bacterium]|nr:MAG: shikimate kinase [Dehalococcoidia bacterium]
MKTSLALVGFMGTGKTVVAKALARRLNKEFIELDSLIEEKAGKRIPEIFQQDGEPAFRRLETKVTGQVAGRKNAVIAGGGGIVLNNINIEYLKKECVIVYLTASPEIILKRTVGAKNERPLLEVADKAQRVRELLKQRQPLYERAADITIDTSELNINSVVKQVIGELKDESFH